MADINITTDFSEVNNLNNALKSTGDLFTKTVDSLVREEARAKRVTKRLADTTQANLDLITKADALVAAKVQQESLKREKTRTREAERAEKEAARLVAAADRIAKAEVRAAEITQAAAQKKALMSASGRAETGFALGAQKANELAQQEKETERLRLSYDRLYAASSLYEKQLRELTQAESLGVISKQRFNKELDQLDMELKQFQNSSEGAILANNRFSQHINESSRGLNKFGMYAQQVGYQVGDFFVQIQSGTNVLVAFGQQATQLAGLFPGVIGAALGIGISLATALGAAFMRSTTEVESSASRQTLALKNLSEAIDQTKQSLDEYRFGGSATAFAENEIKNLESQISGVDNLIQSLTANIESAKNSSDIDAALIARDLAEAEIQAQQAVKKELSDKLVVLKALEEAQRMLNGGLSVAAGIQKGLVYEKQLELRATKEQNNYLSVMQQNYAKSRVEGEALAEAASRAGVAASNLSHISFSNISGAATEALRLAGNLGIALDTASRLSSLGPQGIGGNDPSGKTYGGRGAGPTQGEIVETRLAGSLGYFGMPKGGSGGGSGGGGGGSGGGDSGLEALLTSLQTEREVIDEWYAESQAILQTASDTELQIIGGSHEAKLRLEQEYQDKLKGIRDAGSSGALGDAEIFFGGMADIAKAGGDKTVKAMRIFSAAQALINSYVAFTEVLKDPSFIGRPWARFGAAASALSSGLAAVSAIKGGSGGGGGISRGSAAVASPSASSPAPQTVFIDSLDPDGLYSGQALINLFDAFYDENDKRGKVFVVAR